MQSVDKNNLNKTVKIETMIPAKHRIQSVSVADYEAIISALIHDIRSPLGVITTIRELLQLNDNELNRRSKKDYLDYLDNAVIQTRRIIDDAAQIRNLISGVYSYDKSVINISELLAKVVTKASLTNYGKSIQFDLQQFPKEIESINFDQKITEHVLLRLLEECSYYTNQPGKIILSGNIENKFLLIKIAPAQSNFRMNCNKKSAKAELHGRMGHTHEGISLYTLSLCHHVMSEGGGALKVDTSQESFDATVSFPLST